MEISRIKKRCNLILTLNIVVLGLIIMFSSCNKVTKDDLISIDFVSYNFILKNNNEESFSEVPFYEMKFSLNNQSKHKYFFSSKNDAEDSKTYSRMYLLDTLDNKIISVYSSSRPIINKNERVDIYCSISLKENIEYFKLTNNFFNKINYSSDMNKLHTLFLNMMNNSIIIYTQDEKDLNSFFQFDSEVEAINQDVVIEVQKPKWMTQKYFGDKRKKIKIVKF